MSDKINEEAVVRTTILKYADDTITIKEFNNTSFIDLISLDEDFREVTVFVNKDTFKHTVANII